MISPKFWFDNTADLLFFTVRRISLGSAHADTRKSIYPNNKQPVSPFLLELHLIGYQPEGDMIVVTYLVLVNQGEVIMDARPQPQASLVVLLDHLAFAI